MGRSDLPATKAPANCHLNSKLPDPALAGRLYRSQVLIKAIRMKEAFRLHTARGIIPGRPGDYLCKDPMGNLSIVPKETFETYYREVR